MNEILYKKNDSFEKDKGPVTKQETEDKKSDPLVVAKYPENFPEGRLEKWIEALGNQDYKTAYEISGGSKWGSYNKFLSRYGCISRIYIYEITILSSNYSNATIYADYDFYDPCNNNGRYKQYFYLEKSNDEWFIRKTKENSVIYYR